MTNGSNNNDGMLKLSENAQELLCSGDWTTHELQRLYQKLRTLQHRFSGICKINVAHIQQIDSAGAYFLNEILAYFKKEHPQALIEGLTSEHQRVFDFVVKESSELDVEDVKPFHSPFLFKVGETTVDKYRQFLAFFSFLGELIVTAIRDIFFSLHFSWKTVVSNLEMSGFRALPIVGLMSFLIGLVLAYQLAGSLRVYGANIFVVEVTGVAILREFSPLVTAIVMAGRTSTSFAALIGTMKVNEELDALMTMGITPMSRIVLPRIVALMVLMPLLIVWSDIFGVLGSMLMSKYALGIGFHVFIDRFHYNVSVTHYLLGIIKAPVFSLIIAGVGCFQGLCSKNSADSVGKQTTKAAVQAIFLIIVADAGFSILFNWMNL